MQVTFILQIKFQMFINLAPMLGWECAYVCHNLRTEKKKKKGFTLNSKNIKEVQLTSM